MTRLLSVAFISGALAMTIAGCANSIAFQSRAVSGSPRNWVCLYSADGDTTKLARFDLAVLDADAHPPIDGLKRAGTRTVGYVSLAEVGTYRWYWPEIKDKPWILAKNETWGGHMIDVRSAEWRRFLLKRVIPEILAQGFDGLFLDTIDTAEYLERWHPNRKYPGSVKAIATLVEAIREQFPDVYLIANRGFAVLPRIAGSIDAIVAESVLTEYNFETKTARVRTAAESAAQVQMLKQLRSETGLTVFSLDYSQQKDADFIREVIRNARTHGFVPYISTPQLDAVFMLPAD